MYKNKVQSLINKLHRSYRFTILHSPYLKSNCTTSIYLTDYINVHKLNSADDCLRVLSKSTNSQRYTAVTGWLTPAHQRSHNTQRYTASTSQYRRNSQAATRKNTASLLKTNSSNTRSTPYSTPIYLLHPVYPLLSRITQCTVLFICFHSRSR